MFDKSQQNKHLVNSFSINEETVFKDRNPYSHIQNKMEIKEKVKLPKPSLDKRSESNSQSLVFYGVMFIISLISFGINVFLARFGVTVTSTLAAIISFYCFRYTRPERWKFENKQLPFWNASVTMSVLIKSLHIRIYEWRYVLMYVFAGGLAFSYLFNSSMVGVFGGLYLLLGLCFLAERNFEKYSFIAFILAWLSIVGLVISLFVSKTIPLGIVIIGLLLFQIYERTYDLVIEKPIEDY